MTNINDRIGSQNVIRVLSNASAPPTRLIDLSDVNATLKTQDGLILVWDIATQSFVLTNTIDASSLEILGIVEFNNTTQSTLPTNGALIVNGGVGIGKNLNVGGSLSITGISTFSSNLDINAAVDILNELLVQGNFRSVGVTTLASSGGITTTGGDLYIGGDLYVNDDLFFDEFTARNANITGIASIATLGVTGITTTKNLIVSGVSTFQNNVNVSGFITVTDGIYYEPADYDGPNGIAYFDNSGKLVGSASTESFVTSTNYVLTTNNSGIPVWSSIIDGGEY